MLLILTIDYIKKNNHIYFLKPVALKKYYMPGKPIDVFSMQLKKFTNKMKKDELEGRPKLILVIVANTKDPEIGKGCREDIKSIRLMFDKLADHMKFNFLELVVAGKEYSKENVQEAINLLSPGNNDIVVFYYSGHGFSFDKDESKRYPQIDLRPVTASDNVDVIIENTHNLMDLFEMVKSRGGRLNIVIGDCCNNNIKIKRKFKGGDHSIRKAERPEMNINHGMCESMFCNYTASILVASADKGEFAVSDDEIGSIFTFNFTNNLKILLNKSVNDVEGLPWKKLLDDTKEKTNSLSMTYELEDGNPGNQQAIFIIHSEDNNN
jgi:hypothetical protein